MMILKKHNFLFFRHTSNKPRKDLKRIDDKKIIDKVFIAIPSLNKNKIEKLNNKK